MTTQKAYTQGYDDCINGKPCNSPNDWQRAPHYLRGYLAAQTTLKSTLKPQ